MIKKSLTLFLYVPCAHLQICGNHLFTSLKKLMPLRIFSQALCLLS